VFVFTEHGGIARCGGSKLKASKRLPDIFHTQGVSKISKLLRNKKSIGRKYRQPVTSTVRFKFSHRHSLEIKNHIKNMWFFISKSFLIKYQTYL